MKNFRSCVDRIAEQLVTSVFRYLRSSKLDDIGKNALIGSLFRNGSLIINLEVGDVYKYLGILEADDVKHDEMKEKMRTELTSVE